jgi:hypothetical protein
MIQAILPYAKFIGIVINIAASRTVNVAGPFMILLILSDAVLKKL